MIRVNSELSCPICLEAMNPPPACSKEEDLTRRLANLTVEPAHSEEADLDNSEKTRTALKCGHVFHTECIEVWFKQQRNCPICRTPVDDDVRVVPNTQRSDARASRTPPSGLARELNHAVPPSWGWESLRVTVVDPNGDTPVDRLAERVRLVLSDRSQQILGGPRTPAIPQSPPPSDDNSLYNDTV